MSSPRGLAATHRGTNKLFRVGEPASFGFEEIAENGNNGRMLTGWARTTTPASRTRRGLHRGLRDAVRRQPVAQRQQPAHRRRKLRDLGALAPPERRLADAQRAGPHRRDAARIELIDAFD